MTWLFGALALIGLLLIVTSLSTEVSGGVGTGGLGAIFVGAPLVLIGIIGIVMCLVYS
jgi:hypothetical protein